MIDSINTSRTIKSNYFKDWCLEKFESIVGEFPEIEDKKEIDLIVEKNNTSKSLLKKYKLIRYLVFPIVFLLIIIDELYIRIRECVKNFDKSE